jgi:hypothetical protein
VLVLCRNSEPPDFGSSRSEKGKYMPGHYTPEARIRMIAGVLSIVRDLKESTGIDVVDDVAHDYANYFYPYVKDQLDLPMREFLHLYHAFSGMGFGRYPMFHLYCFVGYFIGEKRFDWFTRLIRSKLGRSPHLGQLRRAHQLNLRNPDQAGDVGRS